MKEMAREIFIRVVAAVIAIVLVVIILEWVNKKILNKKSGCSCGGKCGCGGSKPEVSGQPMPPVQSGTPSLPGGIPYGFFGN